MSDYVNQMSDIKYKNICGILQKWLHAARIKGFGLGQIRVIFREDGFPLILILDIQSKVEEQLH